MATITVRAATFTQTGWTNTANAVDGGTSTFASWASTTANATSTTYLDGFGTWGDIPTGSTITSVSATLKGYASATARMLAPQAQLLIGSTSKSSTVTLANTATTTNVYAAVTSTSISLAELQAGTLRVQFVARHYNGTSSGTQYLDYADVTVTYTPPDPATWTPASMPGVVGWWTPTGTDGAPLAVYAAAGPGSDLTPGGTTRAVYRSSGYASGSRAAQFAADANQLGGPAYLGTALLDGASAVTLAGTFMIRSSSPVAASGDMTVMGRELVYKFAVTSLKPRLLVSSNGTSWAAILAGSTSVTTDVPHVFTAVIGGGTALLRVDGVQVASASFSGTVATKTTQPFTVGGVNASGGYPYDGLLEDVVLGSQVLSAADLAYVENYLTASTQAVTAPAVTAAASATGSGTGSVVGAPRSAGAASATGSGSTTTVATVALPKMSTFVDDFTTQDTTKWGGWSANNTVTGGRAQLVVTNGYESIYTNARYDLTGSAAQIEVPQAPNLGNGTTGAFFILHATGTVRLLIGYESGNLVTGWTNAAGADDKTGIPYDAVAHRFWRIREAAGTTYWETAPDGTTWTVRRTLADPIPSTALDVILNAGYYGTESAPGVALFDNVNTVPVSVAASAAGAGTGTTTTTSTASTAAPAVASGSGSSSTTSTPTGARAANDAGTGTTSTTTSSTTTGTASGSGAGTGTGAAAALVVRTATGTGSGSTATTAAPSTATQAAGGSSGATTADTANVSTTGTPAGSGAGTGSAYLAGYSTAVTAAGSGTGTGAAGAAARTLTGTASGSGSGAGSAATTRATTSTTSGAGTGSSSTTSTPTTSSPAGGAGLGSSTSTGTSTTSGDASSSGAGTGTAAPGAGAAVVAVTATGTGSTSTSTGQALATNVTPTGTGTGAAAGAPAASRAPVTVGSGTGTAAGAGRLTGAATGAGAGASSTSTTSSTTTAAAGAGTGSGDASLIGQRVSYAAASGESSSTATGAPSTTAQTTVTAAGTTTTTATTAGTASAAGSGVGAKTITGTPRIAGSASGTGSGSTTVITSKADALPATGSGTGTGTATGTARALTAPAAGTGAGTGSATPTRATASATGASSSSGTVTVITVPSLSALAEATGRGSLTAVGIITDAAAATSTGSGESSTTWAPNTTAPVDASGVGESTLTWFVTAGPGDRDIVVVWGPARAGALTVGPAATRGMVLHARTRDLDGTARAGRLDTGPVRVRTLTAHTEET